MKQSIPLNDLSLKSFIPTEYQRLIQPLINSPLSPASNKIAKAPELLFVTSYPSRECGIATYSQDLREALKEKFGASFELSVCALEASSHVHSYPPEVKYVLHTADLVAYETLAQQINLNDNLKLIFVQHEFGLYGGDYGQYLLALLCYLRKPVITTFHTLLPAPDWIRKKVIQNIAARCELVVVMTHHSARILESDYQVPAEKIVIIPHGTHLASSLDNIDKKAGVQLGNRFVLTTFGLLGPGKSIETALDALPKIIERFSNVLYLIIGKTHPGVLLQAGEQYRDFLQQKVIDMNLHSHVRFINRYLSLPELLGYLQRTDIYLFTSKDPYQAVSGTFAYAMGCGCPVISTPIPHAQELLEGAGVIIDFQNPAQLAEASIQLMSNPARMQEMKLNALHKIRPTAWPNSALAHMELVYRSCGQRGQHARYRLPVVSLKHIHRLTTPQGMIQFSALSSPDIDSGYTLDDNARALIAISKHYALTLMPDDLSLISIYLDFILRCQQSDGSFLNYVTSDGSYPPSNYKENLEDANGRAIWALGEFLSYQKLFSKSQLQRAEEALLRAIPVMSCMHSPRALAFMIKGLYAYTRQTPNSEAHQLIISLADNLVSKYRGVSDKKWKWFEEYLTYANSVMPEALLCAHLATGSELFKTIAKSGFDFLLQIIFKDENIKVVSHQGWLHKGKSAKKFGEQPVDVAYSILALSRFYDVFNDSDYLVKMESAFNWFLGKNHLHQIMYNPGTGGCYDGLEENHINLNQGAESTLSYLLARLTVEPYLNYAKNDGVKLLERAYA